MPRVGVPNALLRGAKYLAASQLATGGFESQSAAHGSTDAKTYQTCFFPSLILLSLAGVELIELSDTKQKLINFLIAQKSEHWSFNYWDRQSSEFINLPYPDDLDDTFCALAALTKADPSLFDGKVLAVIMQLLFTTEMAEGGPYRTWLVDDKTDTVWQDVDIAVNTNVGYFLSLHEVALPNVNALVEAAIKQNNLSSPYYPNNYPIAYFISRWYRGEQLNKLARTVTKWKHNTPQKAALVMITLFNCGHEFDAKSLAEYLLNSQRPDGSWPAEAFCIDPSLQGEVHYASSRGLTTALCMEALNMYMLRQIVDVSRTKTSTQQTAFYKKVTARASRTIRQLKNPELQANTQALLDRMLEHDDDKQIILLPLLIEKLLGLKTDQRTLLQLATVSLWGWMAYTIYDDFLDGEGRPAELPSANVALRQVTTLLADTLPDNQSFHAEVTEVMNRLDGANAWEIAHCRGELRDGRLYIDELPDYGDYWQLADRSLGHTIAGLGVLYAAGESNTSSNVKMLKKFFHHYLVARQLNDDAHDWQQDLSQTHINAVGVRVLRRWQEKGGALRQGVDLSKEAENLGLIMWQEVIQEVSQEIAAHIAKAREALRKFPIGTDVDLLDELLVPLERASQKAVRERDKAIEFIDTFDD